MGTQNIELLASYFTFANHVFPVGPTEISPYSLQARAEVTSEAG